MSDELKIARVEEKDGFFFAWFGDYRWPTRWAYRENAEEYFPYNQINAAFAKALEAERERCVKIVKESGPTPNPLDLIADIRSGK